MVAYVVAALLTTMRVEVNDQFPVILLNDVFSVAGGLMTSSGHTYLHRHTASSMASDGSRRRYWVRSVYGVYWPGNDFELIPTVKIAQRARLVAAYLELQSQASCFRQRRDKT